MQIIYAEYACECGVTVERMLPIGFDVKYEFHLPCPKCGEKLCLLSASRMVSDDSEESEGV